LLVARRSEDGSIATDGDGAIYKSTDGAENWSRVSMPEGSNARTDWRLDPASPARLYLAAWARDKGEHGEGGRDLFVGWMQERRGGECWSGDSFTFYDVTIRRARDPKNTVRFRLRVFGLEIKRPRVNTGRASLDSTSSGDIGVIPDSIRREEGLHYDVRWGVWHGSVDGDDRAVDIVTPELQPGR